MDSKTIQKLNSLNKQFYSVTEKAWDQTRSYSWPGWETLLQKLNLTPHKTIDVLDIGAGNGRFVQFLLENCLSFNYLGLDFNEELINLARQRYSSFNIQFQMHDLLKPVITDKKFDLITVFGVMHHIPGYENRVNLLKNLKELLIPGGTLAITIWKFNEFDSLQKKIVSPELANIDSAELEKNDFILDWKKGKLAYRYAHYIDDVEELKIVTDAGLEIKDSFRADGKQKEVNKYLLLQ